MVNDNINKFPPSHNLILCPPSIMEVINECWIKLYNEFPPIDRYSYLYYSMEALEEQSKFILESLKTLHEKWCGRELVSHSVYGIRDFYMNTKVPVHRISADIGSKILIKSDKEWGINIRPLEEKEGYTIKLNEGGMLMIRGNNVDIANFVGFEGMYYREIELRYNFK